MTRPQGSTLLVGCAVVLAACSSADSGRAEFIELTGISDEELACVEELADPDDPSPFGVMPDCMGIDRLRTVSSSLVRAAIELARDSDQFDELAAIAEEQEFDLDAYQQCIADGVTTLEDRELRVAFAAPTSEQLGQRLSEPFTERCVGVAQNDPTLGIAAGDLARLVAGAVGRVDAGLQNVAVVERSELRVHTVGDRDEIVAAIAESPVDGNALNVQIVLTNTRLADSALDAVGEQFGFDPPTATNLTVTGSRELDNGLLACVVEQPVRVTIRPGPDQCES